MTQQPSRSEPDAVVERYARRVGDDRYSPLKPDVRMILGERQRAMLRLFARRGWHDRSGLRLLEVGSGGGANLLELLGLGFAPDRLSGVELLAARHAAARALLPPSVTLHDGDATALHLAPSSQDIVLVSTVFSSLLDDGFQQRLAERIWHWTRPGGGVLWYDFTIDNPRNPDVRGVPLRRVRKLFPEASIEAERVTLAPPIARVVSRWHPSLYTLLNSLPMLRTHVLAWLAKT
jgi:SAM-dependent methyltransferase